jgi:hypothetical protein
MFKHLYRKISKYQSYMCKRILVSNVLHYIIYIIEIFQPLCGSPAPCWTQSSFFLSIYICLATMCFLSPRSFPTLSFVTRQAEHTGKKNASLGVYYVGFVYNMQVLCIARAHTYRFVYFLCC